jgi:PAS domain S-box-containing protein
MQNDPNKATPLSQDSIEFRHVHQLTIDDRGLLQYLYNAPDAIIIYDDSNIINYLNLKVTTLLGYHYSELLGKRVDELFLPEHLEHVPLLQKPLSEDFSQVRDRVLVKKNGAIMELESSEQLLPDNRCMMILRDNRWRKRSQDEFRKAIKSEIYEKLFIKLRLFMHGEGMLMNLNRLALFLENTASLEEPQIHDRFIVATEEFKKIIYPELQSIGRYLEALRIDDDTPQPGELTLPEGHSIIEYAEKLNIIFETASRSARYDETDDSLQVIIRRREDIRMMIEAIKKVIVNTTQEIERFFTCSPAEIIKLTVKKYQLNIETVTIGITDTLEDQSTIMNGSEFGGICEILLDNAVEALTTHAQGQEDFDPRIDITLSMTNDKIRIEINDNGPGIKKEHQTLLFKDGFTTKGPGHGFGLSYSAKVIQKYGGQLSYESRQNNGACFVIELLRAYTHNG